MIRVLRIAPQEGNIEVGKREGNRKTMHQLNKIMHQLKRNKLDQLNTSRIHQMSNDFTNTNLKIISKQHFHPQ